MKIYTKTGDKGETGYIGGRISKASSRIEVLGNLDELNASLGLAISSLPKTYESISNFLQTIQNNIFNFGAIIAGAKINADFENEIKKLEDIIDSMEEELKPLQNFILPGGGIASSHIHLARTICRRVERRFVAYEDKSPEIKNIQKYLNRLSDYLFVLARYINLKEGVEDIQWRKS